MDIGYAGCTRKAALEKFSAGMAQSQPDVTFYDWEGWTDMEVSTATACHPRCRPTQTVAANSIGSATSKLRQTRSAKNAPASRRRSSPIGWPRAGWTR